MTPPHYEMTTMKSGNSFVMHGMTCTVHGFVAEQFDDISPNLGLVSKMAELFNLCELPPERMKQAIVALLP